MNLEETERKNKESYRFMILSKDLEIYRKVAIKKNVSVALLIRAAMKHFASTSDFQSVLNQTD